MYARVLLDASTRRFQAQKIYLRASAAHRWAQYRTAVLQGAKPDSSHAMALQATDEHLQAVSEPPSPVRFGPLADLSPSQEVALITDGAVFTQLRAADQQAQCWVGEDPPLRFIVRWMATLSQQ